MRLHMARRWLVSTDQTMTRGPHLLILRLCMQVVENLMEGEDSTYLILFHWLSAIHVFLILSWCYLFCRYTMFANVIDSSQVRVQRGGSSRSAARSSRRSTQDPAEVEQLREELRWHQDYLKQQAVQHEYYATQIQQQQTLIQVSSKDNSFHFKICIDLKRWCEWVRQICSN